MPGSNDRNIGEAIGRPPVGHIVLETSLYRVDPPADLVQHAHGWLAALESCAPQELCQCELALNPLATDHEERVEAHLRLVATTVHAEARGTGEDAHAAVDGAFERLRDQLERKQSGVRSRAEIDAELQARRRRSG
jgi:ribosome-associated translation inhibitor RaiA